ncbi:hypothetical protein N7540_004168 [Penicillium herquei]|nr:hypothetical protein N7540_004168 [Penicillium herquei]
MGMALTRDEDNAENVTAGELLDARVATDSWGFGEILSITFNGSGPACADEKLQVLAGDLTKATPEAHIKLHDSLAILVNI